MKKYSLIIPTRNGGRYLISTVKSALANKYKIPLIEDAAHAVGATYKKKPIGSISDFTMFSFQAIKHITTGDGGMLFFNNKKLIDKAKRIRWFGISRENKQKGVWENDISEVGYKYQMTDLGASLGITALNEFQKLLKHRQKIFKIYKDILSRNTNIFCVVVQKFMYHFFFKSLIINFSEILLSLTPNRSCN